MPSIFTKQNDENILLLQFLSRKAYNQATVINTTLWILAVTSALILPSLENLFLTELGQSLVWILPISVVATTYFLERRLGSKINLGADTKELIDRELFQLDNPSLKGFSKDRIVELAIKEKKKNRKKYEIAAANTGEDKLKGIRDWYSEKQTKTKNREILLCQKENAWFDNSVSTSYAYLYLFVVIVITIGLFFFFKDFTLTSILFTISSYSSLIFKLLSDILNYKNVKDISIATGALINYAEQKAIIDEKVLEEIQEKIYMRRGINYVPLDIIHTIQSVKLHDLWRIKMKFE